MKQDNIYSNFVELFMVIVQIPDLVTQHQGVHLFTEVLQLQGVEPHLFLELLLLDHRSMQVQVQLENCQLLLVLPHLHQLGNVETQPVHFPDQLLLFAVALVFQREEDLLQEERLVYNVVCQPVKCF